MRPPLLSALAEARHLKSRGIPLTEYRWARKAHLNMLPDWIDPRSGLVVDLGANHGDWTYAVIQALPNCSVLAIEPLPQAYALLRERLAPYPNVRARDLAVDSEPGTATFHSTRDDVFGSLLPLAPGAVSLYGPAAAVAGEVIVQTATLDEIIGNESVSLMKIDVQGAEMRAFAGGARALSQTRAVLVEVNFSDQQYVGGSTFSEVDSELRAQGFFLWDLSPPNRAGDGRLSWADALYVRDRSRLERGSESLN